VFFTVTQYNLAMAGTAYSMAFQVYGSTGSGRAGIYTATNPATLLVESDVVSIPVTNRSVYSVSMVPNTYLPAGDYYLAVMTQGNGVNSMYHSFHAQTGSSVYTRTSYAWGSMPSTFNLSGWGMSGNSAGNVNALVCP
jgi:hypothetical protein